MSSTNTNILAIDDEPAILRFLQTNLQLASYVVVTVNCGSDGLRLALEASPDLVLLDLGLPDMDGLELLRQLRHRSDVPVIIISARDDEESIIAGLNLGADDYLVKPFSGRALQARIEAVLRRYRTATPATECSSYQQGPLFVDVAARRVTLEGNPVSLTPMEFALLVEMIQTPGRVRLHSDLLTAIWGPEYRDDVTVLRASIYRLRHKIEPDPTKPIFIRTESGIGYSFATTETAFPPMSALSPGPTKSLAPSRLASHYAFAEGAT
jgi:two-component system KDP operon response regulator KdpE